MERWTEGLVKNQLYNNLYPTSCLLTCIDRKLAETKKKNIFHNEILQIGSKCLVTIDEGPNPTFKYPAYIQDMQPDKGPVSVFVEVLGKR